MNKKLISIAVAAAMAAPLAVSADTTLYGRINNSLVYTDSDFADRDQWDVEDYASRLGVKGSEDLGNGMKGIYQIELQMETADGGSTSRPGGSSGLEGGRGGNSGFGTRLGYVGLSSGWGTLAIGRQWTPYYGSVDKTDIFQIGGTNDAYIGLYRTGDALAYVSPAMGGFSVSGALIISDGENDLGDDFADAYNISVDWNSGPFSVGASYVSLEGDVDYDQWGLGASWKIGDMFAVIGQYEDGDEADSWAVAGQMFFGNNTISVKYGENDFDFDDLDDLDETVVQWEHFMSKRTRVFAVYDMTSAGDTDVDRLGFGVRHDF